VTTEATAWDLKAEGKDTGITAARKPASGGTPSLHLQRHASLHLAARKTCSMNVQIPKRKSNMYQTS
jgi:hypothetical protein